MSGNKTRDGIKLSKLEKTLSSISGVTFREGTNHPLIAYAEGYTRPCPIASSTDAKKMVVSWVKEVTGYTNAQKIYQALRSGSSLNYGGAL